MGIPQSFIQQLVSSCDIEDIISSYVVTKRMGRNLKALCPFHSEKTPSFVIYGDTQSFFCFGCGAGGDVISFIMRAENLEYAEAIKFLANRIGMTVPEEGMNDDKSKLKQQILIINRETARFFNACLKRQEGAAGYKYLRERGLSDQVITSYGLGFAPNSWSSLIEHLKSKGFNEREIIAACVAAKGKNNSIYDLFRNRVMFPIIDLRGNVIAFGGRVLDDSRPKYLNSPDTLVFKKSRNLFSLNFAKNQIKDTLILAEGYMDVIAINAAGFKNVVATLGTALTQEQARLMSKYAQRVVIAYDSDEAGQKATHRAINLLSEVGISTRVLQMEGAKDPDEYIKRFGVKRFQILVDGAADVIEHELKALKQRVDINSAEGKIEYLKKSVNILSDIKNPLEREVYAAIVAKDTGSMLDTIMSQVQIAVRQKMKNLEKREWHDIEQNRNVIRDKVNPQKMANLKEAMAEERIIAFLFLHPDLIPHCINQISPENFVTEFNRRVYKAMQELFEDSGEFTLSSIAKSFSHEEISSISGILARNNNISNSLDTLKEYISVLVDYNNSLKKEQIPNADADELEQYRLKLKMKK